MESKIVARGIQLRGGTRNLLEERVMVGVRRYYEQIRGYVMRIGASGTAPTLWTCAISLELDRGSHIDVTGRASGCEDSVECAVHKLKEKLRKALGEKSPMHRSADRRVVVRE